LLAISDKKQKQSKEQPPPVGKAEPLQKMLNFQPRQQQR